MKVAYIGPVVGLRQVLMDRGLRTAMRQGGTLGGDELNRRRFQRFLNEAARRERIRAMFGRDIS